MAHRPRAPVVLTSFHKQGSLDTYLHEVRSIRESRMLYPAGHRGDDEQTGDEEGASIPGSKIPCWPGGIYPWVLMDIDIGVYVMK